MDPVDAVIFGLAAHRATRLVTKDTITAKLRDRLIEGAYRRAGDRFSAVCGLDPVDRSEGQAAIVQAFCGFPRETPAGGWTLYAEQDDNAPKLATLLSCRWCASIWLVAGLLAFSAVAPRPARALRFLLAGSSVAVLLARIEKS